MRVATRPMAMLPCAAVLALASMVAGGPVAFAQAKDASKPAATKAQAKSKAASKTKSKPMPKPVSKLTPDAKAKAQAKANAPEEPESGKPEPLAIPAGDEPKLVALDRLPKPIRSLHTCAEARSSVELSQERYAKTVLFLLTCPAARGALTPIAVYVARDAQGRDAKRVRFEMLGSDGAASASSETVPSAVLAREAYTEPGDLLPNTRVRNDTAWVTGAWRPDDRPGVCAIAASWRINGEKAELAYWEEATECPKDALPRYETKIDRKPPPLVGR